MSDYKSDTAKQLFKTRYNFGKKLKSLKFDLSSRMLIISQSRICLEGRLFNRTILPNIGLTGQFCLFGVALTVFKESVFFVKKCVFYLSFSQEKTLL